MRKLRLGIVGWNAEVKAYISFIGDGLIQEVQVVAIYVPDSRVIEEVQAYYPFIPVYRDYREMMRQQRVEAVLSFHPSLQYST